VPAVTYTLQINGQAASPEVLAAVQRIEVEDHASLADMMRLRLAVGVREDGSGWTVVDDNLFQRLANLRLTVSVGASLREPLLDACVIETTARFANQPGESMLEVVAMDPSVLMNLEEKVRPWPDMSDSDIASAIYGEYGFDVDVESTEPTRQEVDVTSIQRGTDFQFLRQLAARNGYEVFVETDPRDGTAKGHFHAPRLNQEPQAVLSVNLGEGTNVNSFEARYDMLRPTEAQAAGLGVKDQSDQTSQTQGGEQAGLGSQTTLPTDRPRRVLLSQTGLSQAGELQTLAQAVLDDSAWAIVAEGDLHTMAFGKILRAKRPVLVRGAGRQFSGTYYVERVLHSLSGDSYTQTFSLRRNALALTSQESFMEDNALSG